MSLGSERSVRAGRYIKQPQGYRAFMPAPLPPDPPVTMTDEIWQELSRADRALGRLDATSDTLPNADLFVAMYVRKEAVLSSQIEGTQASLIDVLEFEANAGKVGHPNDIREVVNHIQAMNTGLELLPTLPVSLRLVREIHRTLLTGVRGGERTPGAFRTSQNWIGAPGSTIATARFVPPPPDAMMTALGDLERFIHSDLLIPPLVKVGLIHGQFETVHPFLDGNGRVGRLLITFLLCEQRLLRQPLLYLSYYFKANQTEYYDRLQAVRDHGDWEAWLRFFLHGVAEVAEDAADTAQKILRLREKDRTAVTQHFGRGAATALRLLESLYDRPIVSVQTAAKRSGVSIAQTNSLVGAFQQLGILRELTGRRRDRRFDYDSYIRLMSVE